MPSRFQTPQDPKQPDPDRNVDTTKRYDVYCTRGQIGVFVYRNVLFKGAKTLFGVGEVDVGGTYIELERENGESVFITRFGIMGFCEHGKNLGIDLSDGR